MSDYVHKEFPCCLYHHKIAPQGRVFQNAEETKSLSRGWVDTPAKFPKPSKITVWLKEVFKPWWIEWNWLIKPITYLAVLFASIGKIILQYFNFIP